MAEWGSEGFAESITWLLWVILGFFVTKELEGILPPVATERGG